MGIRVAMVTSLFPPSIGGIQTHTLRVSQKLVERGAEVTLITRRHAGLSARDVLEGVEVVRVGRGDAHPAVATASFVAGAVAALVQRRDRIDVVHVQQMLSPLTVGLLAKPLLQKPLVVNPHAWGAIGDVAQAGRWRAGASRRWADAFIAISEPIREELEGLGVEPERLFRIANGVDVDRFRPASAEQKASLRASLGLADGPAVLYAGRLAKEKGPDVLLEAWARVAPGLAGASLWMLGSGAEEGPLKAQVRALGLEASVRFLGGVQDVSAYVRAADAFVLPSRTEGLPVALLEAMAAGLPSVATAVGGTVEVLEHGVTGTLVPPESPQALAEALNALHLERRPKGRSREAGTEPGPKAAAWSEPTGALGKTAREVALERYSLTRVADAYLELYAGLLSARSTPTESQPSLELGGFRKG